MSDVLFILGECNYENGCIPPGWDRPVAKAMRDPGLPPRCGRDLGCGSALIGSSLPLFRDKVRGASSSSVTPR